MKGTFKVVRLPALLLVLLFVVATPPAPSIGSPMDCNEMHIQCFPATYSFHSCNNYTCNFTACQYKKSCCMTEYYDCDQFPGTYTLRRICGGLCAGSEEE